MYRKLSCLLTLLHLLVLAFVVLPYSAAVAINAPTITHMNAKPVVIGQLFYLTATSSISVEGNAEVGTTVTLYRDNTNIGSAVTAANGRWNITIASLFEGTYKFDADAFDGVFTSARSVFIDVKCDATGPSVSMAPSWGRYVRSTYMSAAYYYHSVSDWGSGLDFSTASQTIFNITGVPTEIPANLSNNLVDRVTFAPIPNDAALKVDGNTYQVFFSIKDVAGNVTTASKTYSYDNTPPPQPIVNKVYDPLHNEFTGDLEPDTNLPDAGGWVDYYPNMTIATQPVKVLGTMWPCCPQNQGFDAYYVAGSPFTTCDIPGGKLDPTNGSFTSTVSSVYYTSNPSMYLYAVDSAGNNSGNRMVQLKFKNDPPIPVLSKIWDPAHHEFTGSGEPTSNLPDAGGWVDFYSGISISSQPTQIIGKVATASVASVRLYCPTGPTGAFTLICYRSSNQIDAAGSFTFTLPVFTDGTNNFQLSVYNTSGQYAVTNNFSLKFIDGDVPAPPAFVQFNPPYQNYGIDANVRLIPNVSGKAGVYPYPQTVYVRGYTGNLYNTYRYAKVVLPAGQAYAGTPGVYDPGDVWQDLDLNGVRTATEPFLDQPPGISDGQTFSLPNFLNLEIDPYYQSYLCYYQSRSPNPIYQNTAALHGYYYTDWYYPITMFSCEFSPPHPREFRQSAQVPTEVRVTTRKGSGKTSPTNFFDLIPAESTIAIYDYQGVPILSPFSSWTSIGSPMMYRCTKSLVGYTFPEGTYRVHVRLKNKMMLTSENSSTTFKIDNTPPMAQDFVPSEGAISNSFSSFNAKVVDPVLSDNSAGSGANLDVAMPQIWPFRLLTTQFTVLSGDPSEITFDVLDGEFHARDHLDAILADGAELEVWEVSSGQYQNASHAVSIVAGGNSGNRKLTVTKASGTFVSGKTYVALYPIPSFTTNNGFDRVGAVVINPIQADGQYVCRVLMLDRAGNRGAFFAPFSQLELAVGPISFTCDKDALFLGLVPPDTATFTSNSIMTRKGNLVQDGQPVTVQRQPVALTNLIPPDANGLTGDGYQVLTGRNGCPTGQGKFTAGVEVVGNTPGSLQVMAAIGLASGSSGVIPIVSIDPFTISPATTTLQITPVNPAPSTGISSTLIGNATRTVPDGSFAFWKVAGLSDDPLPGALSCSDWLDPFACVDNNQYSYAWEMWTAGGYLQVDLGPGVAKSYVELRVTTWDSSIDAVYDVEYSDDGVTWAKAATGFFPKYDDVTFNPTTVISWPYVGAHRYWRMLNANGGWGYYYEMEWLSVQVPVSLTPDESTLPGVQTRTSAGLAGVTVSATSKGTATFTMEIGMRSASCGVTWLDRYPPFAPATMTAVPLYSTGSVDVGWATGTDYGGAGMKDYVLERSLNMGAFSGVATTSALSYALTGLADGNYRFQVRGRDMDDNLGSPCSAPIAVIVDTVPPSAVACSDIGAGNLDPDEYFSVDPNVTFYFTPVDDRSGVADVNLQVSTAADFSSIVYDEWVGNCSSAVFPNGLAGNMYYGRVRVKDRSGNIGSFGSSSNGIMVNYTGAVSAPNAPTITNVAGKPVLPGMPVATNASAGIAVQGMCEASNLIQVFVDGLYKFSVIADVNGSYTAYINLTPGTHDVKVKAHNGFAPSGFSNVVSVVVDQTAPTLDLRIYMTGNWLVDRNWVARVNNVHVIERVELFVTDAGGAGFDINTASITVTDIDNGGTPIVPVGTYSNPLLGAMSVIAADSSRFVPSPSWADQLQDQHKYRISFEATDLAGNRKMQTRDIAVDNLRPGQADAVPATATPPLSDFRYIFLYNSEKYPSTVPPATACVPIIWSDADDAYIVDPAIDPSGYDPPLVDTSTSPVALLFNTPGVYGCVWAAGPYNPAPVTDFDTLAYSTGIAWGWGSSINLGTSSQGHKNWYRYNYRTIVNGLHTCTLYIQDSAICRDLPNMKLNIQSPTPAPHPPISARFFDAANPTYEYLTIEWNKLFAIPGNAMYADDAIISNSHDPVIIQVQVPVETFDQTVEVYTGTTIHASATVPAGNTLANLILDLPIGVWDKEFQIRTRANGYLSTNLPRESPSWNFRLTQGDVTAPVAYDLIPVQTNYNTLSGADARPFPTRFSIRAKDTTNGVNRCWIHITPSSARLQKANQSAVAGTLTREYDPPTTAYGFRYDLSVAPTTEGTYYFYVNLVDGARPASNSFTASYPFRLDKTPPYAAEISPSDGTVTNSLPSFNARIEDPLLADGTPGSGPNMDPSLAQLKPYKLLATNLPTSSSLFSGNIVGVDTRATDHTDRILAIGETVQLCELTATNAPTLTMIPGIITSNTGDVLTVSATGLNTAKKYSALYPIPNFPSNNGIDRVAAVPTQPAIKGGSYLAFVTTIDNSLNKAAFVTSSSIYEAAYGPFTIVPARTSLYVGLVPPHCATYTSSPILTTEGNPIQANTEVNLLSTLGSFAPADSNGIPGDGHQVKSDAAGKITFGLLATGLTTGNPYVRSIIGLASGTDASVQFIQMPAFTVSFSTDTLIISPTTPSPVTNGTTGYLGNAGDPVPNGTFLNAFTSLGAFSPADGSNDYGGHQISVLNASASFSLTSSNAGVASLTFEMGGRVVNRFITFVDRYPPTAPGEPIPDSTLNNTGIFSLMWGASTDPANSGVTAYSVEASLNAGPYLFIATSTLPTVVTPALAAGKYTFRVRALDGAGNLGAYSPESVQVEVDKTPPAGTISINGGVSRVATTAVTLTLSATDLNGVTSMCFSNDNVTFSIWEPYGTSKPWTLSSGDGNKIVYVKYRDSVGNVCVPQQAGITLDTTGPLGSILIVEAPVTGSTTVHMTLNAADGAMVSGMSLQNNLDAPSAMAYVSSVLWNLPAVAGTHTVSVSFIDSIGNRSASYSATIMLDLSPPTTPVVNDDGEYAVSPSSLHATWLATDSTGVSRYVVGIGTTLGSDNIASFTDLGAVTDHTFTGLSLILDGSTMYYFTVRAYDPGGLMSVGYSDGIRGGDPTPPNPVTVTDDGTYTASATSLHATWTASDDPDSGIKQYEFAAGTTAGNTNIVGWTNVGLNLSHTATGLSLTHGQIYYIAVRVSNNGGTSTVCLADGITVDTVAPMSPSMNAEPAYSSGTSNIVSCTLSSDALSGGVVYSFERASDSGFTTAVVNSGWISVPQYEFLGLTHGQKYWYRVRARDAAGNQTPVSGSVSSTQDANPPTVAAYTDEIPENSDPTHIWSRDTTVSFSAAGLGDDLSGVKGVYVEVSTDNTFASVPLWSGWLGNTTGLKTLAVGAPDGSTIYARAKFEDVAGNQTGWYQTDGIRLDLSDPIAGATTDNVAANNDPSEAASRDSKVYFGFSHSDAVSGVADVRMQIATDSAFTNIVFDSWLGSIVSPYAFNGGIDGSTYYARIKVKDVAGRESATFAASSNGIVVDMSAPVPVGPPFLINGGEASTATTTVWLSLNVVDPSGVAIASVSNDQVTWTQWSTPALNPARHLWILDGPVPGVKRVYVCFEDGIGNVSSIYEQQINYFPQNQTFFSTRDQRLYPVDTYEEYLGQNKYGSSRGVASEPAGGKSLRLIKP